MTPPITIPAGLLASIADGAIGTVSSAAEDIQSIAQGKQVSVGELSEPFLRLGRQYALLEALQRAAAMAGAATVDAKHTSALQAARDVAEECEHGRYTDGVRIGESAERVHEREVLLAALESFEVTLASHSYDDTMHSAEGGK